MILMTNGGIKMLRTKPLTKTVSLLLAVILLLSCGMLGAGATDGLPTEKIAPELMELIGDEPKTDVCIVYDYTMTASQQKAYNDADWTGKMALLQDRYEAAKADLLEYIGMICDYEVLCDTSINRIYLRVPRSAVEEIQQSATVKSVSCETLPESKLNDEALKLIAKEDPKKVVKAYVWTDRGDVVAMRDYLNYNKQEMNAYFLIEDKDGVTEFTKIARAYYAENNRNILAQIAEKTDGVYDGGYQITSDGTVKKLPDSETTIWFFAVNIPVGQLETLAQIDGIASVTYEPPKEPDPYANWYSLGGDQDLMRKRLGEPNEEGFYYVPEGFKLSFGVADKEEYLRFKEIEYVKGVRYCRPAPDDGWWKLEGDPEFLSATYGEPNADGRYFVPKKDLIKGDVDYDGKVTVLDATGIQRDLAEIGTAYFADEIGDYDEDGEVSIMDSTRIQRDIADID